MKKNEHKLEGKKQKIQEQSKKFLQHEHKTQGNVCNFVLSTMKTLEIKVKIWRFSNLCMYLVCIWDNFLKLKIEKNMLNNASDLN